MSAEGLAYPGTLHPDAEVAELVDALASGASGGIPVEVRVLFSAPTGLCLQGFAGIILKSPLESPLIESPGGPLFSAPALRCWSSRQTYRSPTSL